MDVSLAQIASDVHCLGPTGRTQTNVYFVATGSTWTLIDAGWAGDGPRIQAAANQLFGAEARARAIVLTHVHPDHSGSALELARAWDCPVYVHRPELAIAVGDPAAIRAGGGPLDRYVIMPSMRLLGARRRDEILARGKLGGVARALDAEVAPPTLPDWLCVSTPGHTPGHASFHRPSDRVVISGDALVTLRLNSIPGLILGWNGLSAPPRYTTWDWPTAKASVAILARLEPDVLATGHGRALSGDTASSAIQAFAQRLS